MPSSTLTPAFLPAHLRETFPDAELLLGLFEASLSGVSLYTPIRGQDGEIADFAIDLLNPAAQRMLQQPAHPRGTYLAHYPQALATGVFAFLRDAFGSGQPARLDVNYQADGLDNYYRLSARRVGQGLLVVFNDTADQDRSAAEAALRADDGHITGVAVVATDVSEQLAARQLLARANAELQTASQAVSARNAALAAANQQLIRTNQDLDNFVYAASHDLKQPVNNLAGLFDELRHATVFTQPEEESLLVPMVDEALRQLATTIDDLAAVGQAQQPHLPAETVDLNELTQEVLSTLQPQVLDARARITTDFAARPAISYARANLRTILLNLLSNALKYADPARPGRVHLSLWLQDARPVLLVEDNGLGFDVERHRGELFSLFRRFHDHTEGTGVGLYLVNRIVQSNGGRVEVESEVGVGSTFRLFL